MSKEEMVKIDNFEVPKLQPIFCYNDDCNEITIHDLLDILKKSFGYREYRYCQKCNNVIMNDLPIN